MKAATLILVLISQQGYWFGDQPQTLTVHWAAVGGLPPAELSWGLTFGEVSIAEGKTVMRGDEPVIIRVTPPAVRRRTLLKWAYVVRDQQTHREVTRGELPIHVFPTDLLGDLAKRLAERKLIVIDQAEGLPKLLDAAGVRYVRVNKVADLRMAAADIILVGPEQLGESLFDQAPILDHAKAGASVFLFRQTRPHTLAGYPLATRRNAQALKWWGSHPLYSQLDPQDLASWVADASMSYLSIQLPADEPALAIAQWPPEVAGPQPSPIDALMVCKRVERGRIVLCQLPLGRWDRDPRSQILLRNVMDYLLTRPEPTPRPSERRRHPAPHASPVPTITISPGAKP
jgi:hypothetical protein